MRIERVVAQNFLSFEELDLALDLKINVVVGPNGSGKTNLIRLLEYVAHEVAGERFEPASYLKWGAEGFKVEVHCTLTDEEIKLIAGLLTLGCLLETHGFTPLSWDQEEVKRLGAGEATWIKQKLCLRLGADLFKLEKNFRISVEWVRFQSGPRTSVEVKFAGARRQLFLYDHSLRYTMSENTSGFCHLGDIVVHSALKKVMGASNLSELASTTLEPADILKTMDDLYSHGNQAHPFSITLQNVELNPNRIGGLSYLDDGEKTRALKLLEDVRRELERRRFGGAQVSLLELLKGIYSDSLIVVRSPRPPVAAVSEPTDHRASTTSVIPHLMEFQGGSAAEVFSALHNSDDPKEREFLKDIVKLFCELSGGYTLLAGLRLADRGRSEPASGEGGGVEKWEAHLQLFDKDGRRVPLRFAPAGVSELVNMCAAVGFSRGRVLILDEPAQNLHPSLQRSLLKRLREYSESWGVQLLVITHSPSLVSEFSLDRTVRFVAHGGSTQIFKPKIGSASLAAPERDIVYPYFRPKLVSALFARAVIIAEGKGEDAALLAWLPKCGFSLEDENVLILTAEGKKGIPYMCEWVKGWGLPFVVFCDGEPTDKEVNNYLDGLEKQGLLFMFKQKDLTDLFEEEKYRGAFDECCSKPHISGSEKKDKSKSPAVAYCVASRTDPPDEVKRLVKSLRVLLGSSGVGG